MKKILIILLVLFLIVDAAGLFVLNKLNKISYDPPATDNSHSSDNSLLPENSNSALSILNSPLPDDSPLPTTGTEQENLDISAPEGKLTSEKGIVNVLLLGTDRRLEGTSDPGRADAVIICSLNKGTGEVKLISFERGVYFPVEDDDPTTPRYDILTHLYHWGGASMMEKTLEKFFLVDIDGYAQVDYEAFMAIVDAMGGVDINLTAEEASALNGYLVLSMYVDNPVKEGVNHLNGHDALAYCRLRSTDDNWGRQQRARNTIIAMADRAKTLNILELNSLADDILPYVHTDLTKTQIASLLLSAPKFLKMDISQMQVPEKNRTEYNTIECDFEEQAERINKFIYGEAG